MTNTTVTNTANITTQNRGTRHRHRKSSQPQLRLKKFFASSAACAAVACGSALGGGVATAAPIDTDIPSIGTVQRVELQAHLNNIDFAQWQQRSQHSYDEFVAQQARDVNNAARNISPELGNQVAQVTEPVAPVQPTGEVASESVAANTVSDAGQAIVAAALSKVGSPYVYGAIGPSAFDCSGLTSWAYNQVGKAIPRTSGAQIGSGQPVSLGALQPGDIVSFYNGGHVGIYVGDGNVVHAPQSGDVVKVTSMQYMGAENAVRY